MYDARKKAAEEKHRRPHAKYGGCAFADETVFAVFKTIRQRRMILRYNVQNRAIKLLEKGTLPTAPRHAIPPRCESKVLENADKTSLAHIHAKSEELAEHLKKVYLTSTSKVVGTHSKRPLPKKENERPKRTMFHEPETPAPGHVTLTNVIEILYKTQDENTFLTPTAIARDYKLDKKDATNLIAYYSLLRLEKFDFMNQVKDEKADDTKALEYEFQKPTKQIAAK